MTLLYCIIQQRKRLLSTSNSYYNSVLRSEILEISSSFLVYKYSEIIRKESFDFARIHTSRRLQHHSISSKENWLLYQCLQMNYCQMSNRQLHKRYIGIKVKSDPYFSLPLLLSLMLQGQPVNFLSI